ncbi:pentatricopeptide repeat-containing protein At2g01860 [Cornus florida]|uniref:pentatricopeptide repeat-containing protein At2g01860 n=1 Tax=Cornus florida TaxID=4283 RepID=UPI00289FD57C|nr:pentatricopeptide repeat-containing protein At2g01860 [Cornus florida]
MESLISSRCLLPVSEMHVFRGVKRFSRAAFDTHPSSICRILLMAQSSTRIYHRKLPKNLRYPRRTKLPPDVGVNTFFKKDTLNVTDTTSHTDLIQNGPPDSIDKSLGPDGQYDTETEDSEDEEEQKEEEDDDTVWEQDEIEAISSLFRGRIPQKPGKLSRDRPLPLPLPYKLRPLGLPTPKKRASSAAISSRQSLSKQVYKNPSILINLAKEIRNLPSEEDASVVLKKWVPFLRKGSLSLTIRELGHMGLPDRALQTFSWAQKQPQLFPDDRILASTVEVLARTRELKLPFDLEKFTSLASRTVIEAMIRGFIKGGSFKLAWRLLLLAKDGKRMLGSSIYAKFILELGKNTDKEMLVLTLLEELGEREDLNLSQQDCTSIMKVCVKLGKFEIAESLFNWFKQSGDGPSVVMYTTMIHSHYSANKYREALTLVWEMEGSNCLFDLPAYRVVIKLLVALNDLPRTVRYFSKLKEAGLTPTYDIYRDLFTIYKVSGRVSKCKEVCREAEMAGFILDKQMRSELLQLQRKSG